MTPIKVTHDIAAPPDAVWALLTDLPRMGEWSPENTGGTWVKGATGPAMGARFVGTNQNGKRRWKTQVTVVTFERPRAFEFEVTAGGVKVARWSYAIEPTDAGCTVTETCTDNRGRLAKALGNLISGVEDRGAHNRAGMERTLTNLAAALET